MGTPQERGAGETKSPAALNPKPFDQRRLELASISQGEMLLLTLPDEETLQEGLQPVHRWITVSERLNMGQFISITNDAGSWFAFARVNHIYGGGRSTALRELSLQFICSPRHADKGSEAVAATGEWYTRWLGAWKKWAVVDPSGRVRFEHVNSEAEATVRKNEAMRNAGTAARAGAGAR